MQAYKPCPFCGGRDVYMKYNGAKNGRFYYIECGTCGGRTRGVCRPYRMIQDPDLHEWDCEQALNVERLWERRADDA